MRARTRDRAFSPWPININPKKMKIINVSDKNLEIYLNLAQSYEGEFSSITKKKPNVKGLFDLDVDICKNIKGFLLYVDSLPAGFAAIAVKSENQYEVCEFYIAPCYRKNSLGTKFAHTLWQLYPGRWEVKQIAGAEYATNFWRKAISSFTQNEFSENQFDDPYWGRVTRQMFSSSN